MKRALRDLVADAIRVQQAGLRVKKPAPPTHRDYPEELSALTRQAGDRASGYVKR
jgi:hypothetical protein